VLALLLLVSFWCLPFSSWAGTTPPGHQLQLPGINPLMCLLDGVVVMCWELWCSPVYLGLAEWLGACSSRALLSPTCSARLLWCRQHHTQSDDWAACEQPGCVCHSVLIWSSPVMLCYVWFGTQMCCTHILKEQILNLTLYTQWCKWQDNLP
jgi:hypothetical protein